MIVRPLRPDDDVVALTHLLHRAYAPLAAAGLRYTATHQSPDVTARRLARGYSFMAEIECRVVGTVTVYPPDSGESVSWYRDPGYYYFGQFGVDPDFQGRGIGKALHQAVIGHALEQCASHMSLDTAKPAAALIATYERWGYSIVDHARWGNTNYESVIMCRRL